MNARCHLSKVCLSTRTFTSLDYCRPSRFIVYSHTIYHITMASTSSSPTSATTTYAISSVTSYTNLGPMPTVLTFPPNCQTDAFDFLGSTAGIGVPWTYYTQGCALSSCCPSSHVYSTPFEWYSKYYSPGVCPYGYATGPVDPIISTASDETVRWCCPTLGRPMVCKACGRDSD